MEAEGLSGWFPHRAVLAPSNSPSGTQLTLQWRVGVDTHDDTAAGHAPTSPHISEGHSSTAEELHR